MSDDVFTVERERMEKLIWESTMGSDDRHKHLFSTGDASNVSAANGCMSDYEKMSVERLARLKAQCAAMSTGKAYLVCPPEFANALVDFPTVQFDSPKVDGMQFRMFQDFGVKLINKHLGIPRSLLYTDIGGSDPVYIPRPAVVEPESPSMLQWCIVVVVLSGLLCAMAGAL